jgi:hypothetical protein
MAVTGNGQCLFACTGYGMWYMRRECCPRVVIEPGHLSGRPIKASIIEQGNRKLNSRFRSMEARLRSRTSRRMEKEPDRLAPGPSVDKNLPSAGICHRFNRTD